MLGVSAMALHDALCDELQEKGETLDSARVQAKSLVEQKMGTEAVSLMCLAAAEDEGSACFVTYLCVLMLCERRGFSCGFKKMVCA